MISIVNPMPLFQSLFSRSYPLIFSQNAFVLVQVEVDVICMQTNFGEGDLFSFGDLLNFQLAFLILLLMHFFPHSLPLLYLQIKSDIKR